VRGARYCGEQSGGAGEFLDHVEATVRGWERVACARARGEIANASVERFGSQTFLVDVRSHQLRAPTEWARGRATYLSGCSGGLERRGRRPRRMRVNMAPRAVSAEMPTHARYTAATALPVTELLGIGDGEGTSYGVARETIERPANAATPSTTSRHGRRAMLSTVALLNINCVAALYLALRGR